MSKLDELIAELCPNGVEYKSLGEIATIARGGNFQKKDFCDRGVPCIHYGQIYTKYGLFTDKTITFITEERAKKQKFAKTNDIIMAVTSENIEDVCKCLAWLGNEDVAVSGHSAIISHNQNPKYLVYYFHSQMFFTQKRKLAHGTKVIEVTPDTLKSIKLPVPPLEVQREIVHILDSFTLLTAELTAELTARKKQYEFYRDKLLTFGNDTLECRLKDICDIFLGLTATPNYTDAGVKFISAQNTSNDFLDLSNVKYISETDFESTTSNAKPQRGDLLFTRVGSNLGHPVIVETDEKLCIFVSLGYLRVRNKKQVVIGYLKHWMNTDLFWSQVRKNVHGAAKVNLNTGWLKEFRISLPPLETQERIVHVLDNFEAICTDLNIGLPAEIEARQKQYEYYRDKLLSFKELPK